MPVKCRDGSLTAHGYQTYQIFNGIFYEFVFTGIMHVTSAKDEFSSSVLISIYLTKLV